MRGHPRRAREHSRYGRIGLFPREQNLIWCDPPNILGNPNRSTNMSELEIGMPDTYRAMRADELDVVAGATCVSWEQYDPDPLEAMPACNQQAMQAWNRLCMQNFGRTF